MKRKAIEELISWKDSNSGKNFLLTGAKGVGKTYLAYDFAKAFFERTFYINFERETGAVQIFQTIDLNLLKENILRYFNKDIEALPESRLIILDELSLDTVVINALDMLRASGLFHYIIIISSQPLAEDMQESFWHKPIFPFEFDEFLLATGNEWYIETIHTHFQSDKKIPDIVHKELMSLYRLYLQIGGMPGIINEYLSLSSLVNISEQHSLMISVYHDYILKDNPEGDSLKMNQVFDSLALQLMKENKKFQFKLIRKGTTYTMYKEAIQNLVVKNYALQSKKITSEQLQHSESAFDFLQEDDANSNFKLYLPDTGLLFTKMIEEKGIHFDEYMEKALLENFVAQALHTKGYPLYFWESESMAKVDFIIRKGKDENLIPVEIFTSDNTRSKCISVLKQHCSFPYAVKISSRNFSYANDIKYIPYYAVHCL